MTWKWDFWEGHTDAKWVASAMLAALIVGIVVTMVGARSAAWEALLWALACSSVGWFLGFLFGIPRSLASDSRNALMMQAAKKAVGGKPALPEPSSPVEEGAERAKSDSQLQDAHFAVNTNLEQISDWLTKIIVGVTLVEINAARDRMRETAMLIAGSLGDPPSAHLSFAYAILIYFSTSGFVGSYLLTRLFLQRAFDRASS